MTFVLSVVPPYCHDFLQNFALSSAAFTDPSRFSEMNIIKLADNNNVQKVLYRANALR